MAHHISCLCKGVRQEVVLGPLAGQSMLDLCHCTACRAVTGQLCSSYHSLHKRPQELDSLVEYHESPCISRYFCNTCGAHVFARQKQTGQYFVAAGLLEENPHPFKSTRHWRAEDTRDGGLTSFLPTKSGDASPGCYLHVNPDCQQSSSGGREAEEWTGDDHRLPARCHCGGIGFYVTSPDLSSKDASSPWPDLLVPYYSGSSENTADVKWWLREEGSKYLAGTCACRSCRLASGFPIQTWAFIPKSNLQNADGTPLSFGSSTMQQYESSPGVYREFCGRCGATVFWHCEIRPLLIDVSVGLLRAKSGARAEDWLEWHPGRVSFSEMAVDPMLIRQLEAGLKVWGESRGRENQLSGE
ncbi:hypothetical protein P170DRAFT_11673 [Aspergillus steynii IBT 23096]|uniref:CENP-V/GFA domain-containing protein n=1 Tax=Aspergillus steynii IBT 23096 TaxID=1392250 RepID=A0A2I2GN30_9EURO|nr:uncharacterized protein P170DRAFT_11673 [Aspergillus steynii IBT 23096]PLB54259.1 hypothetical protein P170DRAFT_11673 [Aspergillus steynii IBT 23096]